jgi:hypothetical protein
MHSSPYKTLSTVISMSHPTTPSQNNAINTTNNPLLTTKHKQKCATTPPPLLPQTSASFLPAALDTCAHPVTSLFSGILTTSIGSVVLVGVL